LVAADDIVSIVAVLLNLMEKGRLEGSHGITQEIPLTWRVTGSL
jgi:hypothetical protein